MREASPALGVVLAGGAGSRMGGAKPGTLVGGRALIERPLEALAAAGLDAVVVAKADSPLPPLAAPRWDEPAEPVHPLSGIVSALERADGPIVVLACDMPFVPPALIERLAQTAARAVVPKADGMLQPLAARYAPEAHEELSAALERHEPLRDAVAALDPLILSEDELRRYGDVRLMFANLNTPEDLELLGDS